MVAKSGLIERNETYESLEGRAAAKTFRVKSIERQVTLGDWDTIFFLFFKLLFSE